MRFTESSSTSVSSRMKVALNTVRSALSCFRCSRFSFAAAASAGQYFMTRAAFCVSRASLLGAIFINPDPSRCPFGTEG